VIFATDHDGGDSIYRQRADGQGTPERLTTADKSTSHLPQSVSRDGALMLFDKVAERRVTLMVYSFKDGTITPFGGFTSLTPTGAEFSPDGKWIAYSTREPGQTTNMTYVQPYPATGAKFEISTSREDGHHQVWSPDGKELFYTPGPGNLFTAVKIRTAPSFAPAPGDPVQRPFTNAPPSAHRVFDIGGPGVRFLGLLPAGVPDSSGTGRPEIRVVLNWSEELKARVK